MGASPVSILIIIGIYTAFFAVISSTANPEEPEGFGFDRESCDAGINDVCGLADILNFVFRVVRFVFDALTFNVAGAPAFIRVPIAIAIISSLVWSVISLIRGTEG